jgi:multidrug resistance efflux pump
MDAPSRSLVARHRGPIIFVAIVLAAFLFGLWWLSMADASMTGCGGG